MEEMVSAAACWMWDYLRRSGATGFVLPLSGGADSASTASIVFQMCRLMVNAERSGNKSVKNFIGN